MGSPLSIGGIRVVLAAWCKAGEMPGKTLAVSLFCLPTPGCQLSHTGFRQVKPSPFDLSNKVALVTGSTRGIGKSIAEVLARAGARVSISSRKADACEQARADLEGQGFQVMAMPCNVSRKEELQGLVDATRQKWGRIDIVVANAASNPYYGPLTGISDDAFDKIMANNVKSTLWLAGMTLPGMGGGGSFIVVGSIGGLVANTVIGAYGISKAADHHLVRNLAAEWGPQNIRINAIAPGLVKTEFARALWEDEKRAAERVSNTPLRRLGEPRDIGAIAVFLASEAAAFITGQVIVADGGVTIL
jgi:NAD(P)-dependent dehydrogenase (short-subunit alcohol dehydrogenase family)